MASYDETARPHSYDGAAYVRGAPVHKAVCSLNVDTAQGALDQIIPICELPPEAIVTSIEIVNGGIDTDEALTIDLGIYECNKAKTIIELIEMLLDSSSDTLSDFITAKDVDIYCDGSTEFGAANSTPTQLLGYGTNSVDGGNMYKTVRAHAGDSVGETPLMYLLAATVTAAGTSLADEDLTVIVEWVQG